MNLELKNKKALVTAASYGLGYACAKVLASEGVDLVICSRDDDRVQSSAKEISLSGSVRGVEANLTQSSDLENLIVETESTLGDLDILVLSTGHPPTFPFSKASDEHWETGIDLILRPVIALSRHFLSGMRERGYGRLIFIGSIFGIEPEVSSVVQSTLRTGLNALAKCIATESAADGVTANVICPGYFNTPLVQNLAKKYADETNVSLEQVLDDWKTYAPSKEFGEPEDLGALVALLASPKGKFINGTSMVMDGGAIRSY